MVNPRIDERIKKIFEKRELKEETRKAYRYWIKRFENFTNGSTLSEIDEVTIQEFMEHLKMKETSLSTRKQALYALRFFYKEVLSGDVNFDAIALDGEDGDKERLPHILPKSDVKAVLAEMKGRYWLMANLLYGAGLRLMECINLRIRDLDFGDMKIIVRDSAGMEDHITILPQHIQKNLARHIRKVKIMFEDDLFEGFDGAYMTEKLLENFPDGPKKWEWQFVFPSRKRVYNPESGKELRHPISGTSLQRAIKKAVRKTDVDEKTSAQTLRHSFATHLVQRGYPIESVQRLLGHKDIRTTKIYEQLANAINQTILSPLDF